MLPRCATEDQLAGVCTARPILPGGHLDSPDAAFWHTTAHALRYPARGLRSSVCLHQTWTALSPPRSCPTKPHLRSAPSSRSLVCAWHRQVDGPAAVGAIPSCGPRRPARFRWKRPRGFLIGAADPRLIGGLPRRPH
jgi:hypothetical protein